MRLVIEKRSNRIYCSFIKEGHYQSAYANTKELGKKISKKKAQYILDRECNMADFPDNTWFAAKIGKKSKETADDQVEFVAQVFEQFVKELRGNDE